MISSYCVLFSVIRLSAVLYGRCKKQTTFLEKNIGAIRVKTVISSYCVLFSVIRLSTVLYGIP